MSWLDTAGTVLDTCMGTFAEPVSYVPSGGAPVDTVGIFDDFYEVVDPNTGAVVTSTQPILGVKNDKLPEAPKQDDTLTVRGRTFRVKDVQPDGHGGSKLFLHEL